MVLAACASLAVSAAWFPPALDKSIELIPLVTCVVSVSSILALLRRWSGEMESKEHVSKPPGSKYQPGASPTGASGTGAMGGPEGVETGDSGVDAALEDAISTIQARFAHS